MRTKALRIPDELAGAVRDVGSTEHIQESAAMRKLLFLGDERYLADRYRAGEITVWEMVRQLGTSLSEALDLLQRQGIAGNVGCRGYAGVPPVHGRGRGRPPG